MSIKKDILKILPLFVIWRLYLFLIAFISPLVISTFGGRFPYYNERLVSSNLPQFVWSFGNFDGVHYLGIAKDAYSYQFTQAFFPLYPILIKIADLLVRNLVLTGLIISNICFAAALVIFYRLIKQTNDEKTAFWSISFILAFPTSFFFGAIYTESLFLLLLISSFYFFQKRRIILASIFGAFASATRLAGLFITPAISLEKKLKIRIAPLLIVPIGFLLYILYLQVKFHNPFYFFTAQSVFGQERSQGLVLLPQVIWRYIKILLTTSGLSFVNAAFELASTALAFVVLYIAFRKKLNSSWLIFSIITVVVPTLTGTLTSMPRYILLAFPIYVVFAQIKNSAFRLSLLMLFAILLAVFTALFTRGYWVA